MTSLSALTRSRSPRRLLLALLAATWMHVCPTLCAGTVKVRLKNGDFVEGEIVASHEKKQLTIKSPAFDTPLNLHIDAISSLKPDEDANTDQAGAFVFALNNQSSIVGTLVALTEEQVTVRSSSLGELTFPRSLLSECSALGGSARNLFSGPKPGQEWQSPSKKEAWTLEAGTLTTELAGHSVHCDAMLTAQCEVRINLAWSGAPGFVLALGTTDKQPEPAGEAEPAVVRLESWDDTLVMIREVDKTMDFVALDKLASEGGRLNIVLFIDRNKGEVIACSPTGKVLGRVQAKMPGRVPPDHHFVRLLNTNTRPAALQLERLSVRPWNGNLANLPQTQNSGIVTDTNEFVEGKIGQYDAATQTIAFVRADATTTTVPLKKLTRALFSSEATLAQVANDSVEVQFVDGSSCIGSWESMPDGKCSLQVHGLDAPVVSNLDQVSSLSGNALSYKKSAEGAGRIGTLETAGVKLSGHLVESAERGLIHWKSVCAASPCKLSLMFEGRVQYESVPAPANEVPNVQANAVPAAAPAARMPGVLQFFLGSGRTVETANKPAAVAAGLHFRSGDVIDGQVQQIDERGVTYKVGEKTNLVPQDKVESVTLVNRGQLPQLPPEKLKQLTTIPRAAKSDPPTHLFISVNGDYLRGRLVKYVDSKVTAEIRLENVEFPAGSIAQIIWLYNRDWDTEKEKETKTDEPNASSDASPVLQVHAIQRQAKAITFVPTAVTVAKENGFDQQVLKGDSEIVGDCEVVMGRVTSLVIGRDVGAVVRKQKKDGWKLSIATLPKVYQEGDATESGSPLVDQAAPDFTLDTIGGSVTLSQLRGNVTVLDFWASWCGPCMQTMPEVERIVEEVGDDKVKLIAVNLQETKDRVLAAVKRLELSATVAMDIDGEVAEKYQASAIPQTVIVDREGKVTHVFVGGGARFLKQFEEALTATLSKP